MNRVIRGMAGLIVALGASACANDYSLDFGGDPTHIQASPQVMFVNQGATEELLVRLVNDRNESTPAAFAAANVGAGITVVRDVNYRPDNINPEKTLQSPEVQSQMRFYVTANTNVSTSFTITSGSFSTTITVRVVPTNVGGLSIAEPAIGDPVTITAPGDVSFNTTTSTVSFGNTGAAVITELTAKSITFVPIPGSTGFATVDHVTADYAANLGEFTLKTTNEITVPAVTSIPLAYSKTNIGATETVTVTATGFRFEAGATITYNTKPAFVMSRAADGTSMVILAPTGLAAATGVASGVHLASLPAISLSDLPSSAAITTGSGYAQLPGTGTAPVNGGGQPVFAVPAPGTGMFIADMPSFGDAWWDGAAHPSSWYKINVTGTGDRDLTMGWNNSADVDFWVTDEGINFAVVQELTGANPEHDSGVTLTNGTAYWIIAEKWSGASPSELLITIR